MTCLVFFFSIYYFFPNRWEKNLKAHYIQFGKWLQRPEQFKRLSSLVAN